MDLFEGGYDSLFTLIGIVLLLHIGFAIFETMELKWKPTLSVIQFTWALVIIWFVPLLGPFIAREIYELRKVKGGAPIDESSAHLQINQHHTGD